MNKYTITTSIDYSACKVSREDLEKCESLEYRAKMSLSVAKAYGLEGLYFYKKGNQYRCKYISDENTSYPKGALDLADLIFLLQALSMGQGRVYFDDVDDECCIGIDSVKSKYLIFRLSGL